MEFSTSQYLLGTPETSRRGRSTRKARRALTSNPPGLPPCPCIDGWLLSPSPSAFSSLVKSSKTTLKSLSENKEPHTMSLPRKTHCFHLSCYIVCSRGSLSDGSRAETNSRTILLIVDSLFLSIFNEGDSKHLPVPAS